MIKLKTYLILSALALLITFVLSYLTFEMMYIKVPAVGIFGISFILILWILDLLKRLHPICINCKGYGAINLRWWQKIINALLVGTVGEKCKECNGSGIINISKLYKEQLGNEYIAKGEGRK